MGVRPTPPLNRSPKKLPSQAASFLLAIVSEDIPDQWHNDNLAIPTDHRRDTGNRHPPKKTGQTKQEIQIKDHAHWSWERQPEERIPKSLFSLSHRTPSRKVRGYSYCRALL